MHSDSNPEYDAIIIGAGHNGLVTAVYLARAGWSPLVLERNDQIGGAIRSSELTEDEFIHDTYSTNQNLFLGSPVYEDLADNLADHGLTFSSSSKPYCNVFPDGTCLRAYQDEQRTLDELRRHDSTDAEGWSRLYDRFQTFQQTLLPLYTTPLPSAEAGKKLADAVWQTSLSEVMSLGQLLTNSTRELGDEYFATPEAKALVATWGLHLDYGPDVSGGAMFPFLETFTDMTEGISIATGGASNLVEALAGVLRDNGGEIRTNAEVKHVLTNDNRATGVELASGERIGADRAVVANLTPTVLFEDLLSEHPLPDSFQRKVDSYTYGPGTMMVHLALDELPDWDAADNIDEFAYVHIAPYVEDLARTYTQAVNGYIPESPLLIVGQTTAVDSSRTPNDEHILWIQVRALPSEIRGDAANEINATDWDTATQPVADRVIDKLDTYAPGIEDSIRERAVLSPADLERENPNLVGGDSVGGSHHLKQNFLFRPFLGYSRYEMPVDGLYMTGAGTWPGGGNNGTSGYLAAQRLLRPDRTTQVLEEAEERFGDEARSARKWVSQRL
jgi:phytoene dehydrogenase-like protein